MCVQTITAVAFLLPVIVHAANKTSDIHVSAFSAADVLLTDVTTQLSLHGLESGDSKVPNEIAKPCTEVELLAQLRRQCRNGILHADATQMRQVADTIIREIEGPSLGDEIVGPMEEILSSLLLAGIAYDEMGHRQLALKCYRTIIHKLTDDAACPTLVCSTLQCLSLALANEDRIDEALTASKKAREIAFSIRHEIPDLFVICASTHICFLRAEGGTAIDEIDQLNQFVELRRHRIGFANAYAFCAAAAVRGEKNPSFLGILDKAIDESEKILGTSHSAGKHLALMRLRVLAKME